MSKFGGASPHPLPMWGGPLPPPPPLGKPPLTVQMDPCRESPTATNAQENRGELLSQFGSQGLGEGTAYTLHGWGPLRKEEATTSGGHQPQEIVATNYGRAPPHRDSENRSRG